LVYSVYHCSDGLLVPPRLLACIATAMIITSPNSFFTRKIVGNTIMMHVGHVSYASYLWHWPACVFVRSANFKILASQPTKTLALVLSTYSASLLSRQFVEEPCRGKAARSRMLVAVCWLLALLLSAHALSTQGWRYRVSASAKRDGWRSRKEEMVLLKEQCVELNESNA
jgi:peptidoglycan/LPS O-acetylase OafA/YrhL